MKVGIITRHAIANYGSILQSYATQKIFEDINCTSQIINYIREDEKTENLINTYINSSKFFSKNFITKMMYKIAQGYNIKKMNNEFAKFREKYLKLTEKEYNNSEDFKENLPEFDIYCTGSDQVWGKIGNDEFDENYFLEFVPKDKKCISYAASFGKSSLSEELSKNIKELTNKYSTILVREDTAKQYLKENNVDSNVQQVLDPTLLLDSKEWEKLVEDINLKKPYYLVYQLHHNKEFEKYVKNIERKGITVYRINPSIYFAMKPGKFIYLPTPGQFLGAIKNAECVLTDSFHGTVFSLIFNRNFIDFLPKVTGTRISSLLKLVNLEERIINNKENFEILNKEIDFNKVNNTLNFEREKSIKLLKDAINK